jgi:hypothetical protein
LRAIKMESQYSLTVIEPIYNIDLKEVKRIYPRFVEMLRLKQTYCGEKLNIIP